MADYEDFKYEDIKREVIDLRQKLEQEKQLRMILELRARTLDTHQYAEKIQNVEMHEEPQTKPALPRVEKVNTNFGIYSWFWRLKIIVQANKEQNQEDEGGGGNLDLNAFLR